MKLNKWILAVALLLSVGMATTGTLAYLQDSDSDVNVMTLGKVEIDQLEYERVVDDKGNTTTALQAYNDDKPLLPAVFPEGGIKYDANQQSWGQINAPGSCELFVNTVKNVQDKMVFVKNTGKSAAYVRTIFAFEAGSIQSGNFKNVMQFNTNGAIDAAPGTEQWNWTELESVVNINGNNYVIMIAEYAGAASAGRNGILAAGAVSYPSLLQIYMKPEATNEDVEAIDGNKNGKYDILVLSQAVQAEGFTDATTALNAGFGVADDPANIQEWFKNIQPTPATSAATAAELNKALAQGDSVVMSADISGVTETVALSSGAVLDGNNKTLSFKKTDDGGNYGITPAGGTIKNITITGEKNGNKGFRAVYVAGANDDVVIENATLAGTYALNTGTNSDADTNDQLIVRSSKLKGWVSGGLPGGVVFEDCKFEEGPTAEHYKKLRIYHDTDLTNCTFCDGFTLDAHTNVEGKTVTLINCTYNGVKVTAENFESLFDHTDADPDDKVYWEQLKTKNTVIVDSVKVVF